MYYLGLFLSIFVVWVVLIATASLLAAVPFFFFGCLGKLLEMRTKRKERCKAMSEGARNASLRSEAAIWREAQRSHASLFEGPGEPLRRAG